MPEPVGHAGDVARRGYLWRVAETEVFSGARGSAPGLEARLRSAASLEAVARELADAETLRRPDPGDADAFTWQVPGPGGHVRHYGALACIEAAGLADRTRKRDWLFGFAYRCCEEIER